MEGEALAMLDTSTATPWTRCAYDHRLRNQVVRTGTRCLPKHIWIPRSTASSWRRLIAGWSQNSLSVSGPKIRAGAAPQPISPLITGKHEKSRDAADAERSELALDFPGGRDF
jgi:hypothetical protein